MSVTDDGKLLRFDLIDKSRRAFICSYCEHQIPGRSMYRREVWKYASGEIVRRKCVNCMNLEY